MVYIFFFLLSLWSLPMLAADPAKSYHNCPTNHHSRVVVSTLDQKLSLTRVGTDRNLHDIYYQIQKEWHNGWLVSDTCAENYQMYDNPLWIDLLERTPFLGPWVIYYDEKPVGIYEFLSPGREGRSETNTFLRESSRTKGLGTIVAKTALETIISPELGKTFPDVEVSEGVDSIEKMTPDKIIKFEYNFIGLKGTIANTNYASLISTGRAGWGVGGFEKESLLVYYPPIDVKAEATLVQRARLAVELLMTVETREKGQKELEAIFEEKRRLQ